MSLITEIESVTNYNNTDVSNAVTEATNYCAMHDVTDDEIVKTAAIWLLERLVAERKSNSDNSVRIPSIKELHDIIENLKGQEVDTSTKLIHKYKSPREKGKSPFSW